MRRNQLMGWRWLLGTFTVLIGVLFIDEAFVKRREVEGLVAAIAMAGLVGGWTWIRHRAVAVAVAGVCGLPMMLRPWLLPITFKDPLTGIPHELSPTAERNLYALLPGLALCALAAVLALTSRRR